MIDVEYTPGDETSVLKPVGADGYRGQPYRVRLLF